MSELADLNVRVSRPECLSLPEMPDILKQTEDQKMREFQKKESLILALRKIISRVNSRNTHWRFKQNKENPRCVQNFETKMQQMKMTNDLHAKI